MSGSKPETVRPQVLPKAGFVSVIIPCYNHGRFLGEAIESVLAQSYAHFELIVVDDGSTDDTADVVQRFPSVAYYHQKNAGRSAARNAGLRQSRGEFVAFLDADDRLLPNALQRGVDCLAEHPECAFVSGRCQVIDANNSILSVPRQRCVERDHYIELLRRGTFIWCPATVLYRRSVFDFVHGFDPTLVPVEDYDLYLRITKDFAVYCHGDVIAEYRQHSTNTSRDLGMMQKAALAAHQAQWKVAKGNKRLRDAYHAGHRFWREQYPVQHMITRIREIVRERVPPDATVAVASGGNFELLRLDGRQAWHFPQRKFQGELFAEGAEGSAMTDHWIEAGMTYEFALYPPGEMAKPLARVLVRGVPQARVAPPTQATEHERTATNGASLTATPNPVPVGDKPGATNISWRTGDDCVGRIYISSVGVYAGRDPLDSAEARTFVDDAVGHGAQYLLLPAKSFYWLDRYADFREEMEMRYPAIVHEDDACVIFDLRARSK